MTVNKEPVDSSASSQSCTSKVYECMCCTNFSVAHHPTGAELAKSKGSHESSQSIQSSWFTKHPWISACMPSYKIYCRICCSARNQDLVTFSKRYMSYSTFVEGGFSNWRKALQRFAEHEMSEMHRESCMKVSDKACKVDVQKQLSKARDGEMQTCCAMFLKLLECIRFLARQGLPFHGHCENDATFERNLYQLLLLQAKNCPSLSLWLKERDYISPEIVNEIITVCGQRILTQLLEDIKAANYFTVIADGASDISHNEQMCIALRWVDSTYTINEAALGLIKLPDTKALALFSVFKDVLLRC